MFHIRVFIKCDWNFGGFSKIHITFYKHILNIHNGNNVQQNYLLIEPLLNLVVEFFVEKTRSLSIFFSNSEFGMRVYKGKIEARSESISLYTFLRLFPRKINILKKTKLDLRELNELDDMNVKKVFLNLTNILKSTTKMPEKWKIIKVFIIF